jgi:hypothetical protein
MKTARLPFSLPFSSPRFPVVAFRMKCLEGLASSSLLLRLIYAAITDTEIIRKVKKVEDLMKYPCVPDL